MELEFEINKEIKLKVKMSDKPTLDEYLGLNGQIKAIKKAVDTFDKKNGFDENDDEDTAAVASKPKMKRKADGRIIVSPEVRLEMFNLKKAGEKMSNISRKYNLSYDVVWQTMKRIEDRLAKGMPLKEAVKDAYTGKKEDKGVENPKYSLQAQAQTPTTEPTLTPTPAAKSSLSSEDKMRIWTLRQVNGLPFKEIARQIGYADVQDIATLYYLIRDKVSKGEKIENVIKE